MALWDLPLSDHYARIQREREESRVSSDQPLPKASGDFVRVGFGFVKEALRELPEAAFPDLVKRVQTPMDGNTRDIRMPKFLIVDLYEAVEKVKAEKSKKAKGGAA